MARRLIFLALVAALATAGATSFADLGRVFAQDERSLAPFVPTPQDVVDRMLELAEVTSDDVVYDLGCGELNAYVSVVRTPKTTAITNGVLKPKRLKVAAASEFPTSRISRLMLSASPIHTAADTPNEFSSPKSAMLAGRTM